MKPGVLLLLSGCHQSCREHSFATAPHWGWFGGWNFEDNEFTWIWFWKYISRTLPAFAAWCCRTSFPRKKALQSHRLLSVNGEMRGKGVERVGSIYTRTYRDREERREDDEEIKDGWKGGWTWTWMEAKALTTMLACFLQITVSEWHIQCHASLPCPCPENVDKVVCPSPFLVMLFLVIQVVALSHQICRENN